MSDPSLPQYALADALAHARTVEEIADALVRIGQPAVGACVTVLALLNDDGSEFFCPRITGYSDRVAEAWRRFPADAALPIVEAVRENRPVFLETLDLRLAYYPPGNGMPPPVGRALAAVPFRQAGVVGGLGFTFPDDRRFGPAEQGLLDGVAGLCAAALGRVRRGGLGCEVLLVDDEPSVRAMLDFALRSHAFTVRRAAGGAEALAAYRAHRGTVAVVLLDVLMPEMDGPQTLAAIREVNPAVRAVFMSGHTGRYSAADLLSLGASHVFQKPFSSLDQVIRVLGEVARRE
ncbi:response regulator [Limnoglobus roseus]|uniref:Response regulator n=1 Tax=Limnoglobus roseus TaxID=2598579 RepID=A0A5C1AHM5_9BACT|nr:response regulator [Limnoglobus roseus]QEL16634.1 response regulator [Limnoglobus roseus]